MRNYMRRFVMVCGVGMVVGAAAGPASAAYRIKMPWRGDSLPANTYFVATGNHTGCDFGSEACELDIGALRWDTVLDDWSESIVAGDADWSETNVLSDDPIYGAPLYSPVDGEVISCWAGMVDRTNPSVNPCPTCVGAGNHVTILTDDGRIVFLGHLQKDSIPPSVCPSPNRGTTNAPDGDEDTACDSVTPGWTKISSDLVLSPRPQIRKGDHVGNVGATGTMGGDPHLHFHVKPFEQDGADLCVGFPEEIRFDEGFIQDQLADTFAVDADWDRLIGSAVPWLGNAFSLLWGDPSGILVDSVAVEPASAPALALTGGISAPGGVAAYINSSGNFEAVGFGHDSAGLMTLAASNTQSAVNQVALAPVNTSAAHVVAAVRTSANKLLLIPYFVQSNHTLVKGTAPAASAGTISLVAATRSPNHDGVVTAVKDSSGFLKVENFGASVSGTNLTIDARDTATSSSVVSQLDIATLTSGRALSEGIGVTPFKGVVTVEHRTSDHTAFLRTWSINAAGTTVALDTSVQVKDDGGAAFVVDDVEVATVGDSTRELAVVAVQRASDDRMFVLTYQIDSTGTPTRISQIQTGPVTALSLAEVGNRDVLAGVRTSGALSLLSFTVGVDGVLGRVGTRDGGAISALAVDGNTPGKLLVSAVIDGSGDLALHSFNTNYSAAL